jgi:hypothetical protein
MKRQKSIPTYKEDNSQYFQPNIAGIPSKIIMHVRKKMYKEIMEYMRPTADTTILDVGVTNDKRPDTNFFEKLYPYPHMITAIGTEDASFLEEDFPGLKFIKVDGIPFPFEDNSFDILLCFATIEHVGSKEQQRAFVQELCRISRFCCITTPNRWYPIEFHSILPFIHWFPPSWFRALLRLLGKSFLAKEENLNILSEKEMLSMFPNNVKIHIKYFRLFGLVSNLMFFTES